MRLQQVFVINWKSFYLKNFTIQKQGPQGIRPLLISFHRTQNQLVVSECGNSSFNNKTPQMLSPH
jgi:hypothetical protein